MSFLIYTIAMVMLVILLLVVYMKKCFKFWKNRGVPSTSPNSLFGDMGQNVLGRKQISTAIEDIYKAFPNERFFGFYMFIRPCLMIRDPELIESVLVKDFHCFTDRLDVKNMEGRFSKSLFILPGQKWKNLRSKLVTTFSTRKMKQMMTLMDGCADILNQIMKEKSITEATDVKEVISRFAIDVVGCCFFGLQFNTLTEPKSNFRKIGKLIFNSSLRAFITNIIKDQLPKLAKALKIPDILPEVELFMMNLLKDSEDFRKTESVHRNDLMQLILDVRDQDRDRVKSGEKCDDIVDDDVILSNMMVFFAAGFETTATTLSFCLYELALQPEIQQRVRDEVRAVIRDYGGVLTYEALKKMTYSEMVISETLRKYPPVGMLMRICTSPYKLPGSDIHIPLKTQLAIPVSGLHHDEKFYPDPERFDPERFNFQNISSRPAYTYMPFGDGPRICIAVRFAKMEMKVCLARIISNYVFSPCSKTAIPIQIHPRAFILNAKNEIYLKVQHLSHTETNIQA